MWSIGNKVVYADLIITYFIPAIFLIVFGANEYTFYVHNQPGVAFWLVILATATLFIIFVAVFDPIKRALAKTNVRGFMLPISIYHAFALVFLASSTLFFWEGLNFYRYDNNAASEQLSATLVLVLFGKSIISSQIFYGVATNWRACSISRWYWILVIIALGLTVDGTMSFLLLASVIFITQFPRLSRYIIYSQLYNSRRFITNLSIFALLGISILLIWFIGESIKRGSIDSTRAIFFDLSQTAHLFNWLIDRVSTIFFSANQASYNAIQSLDFIFQPWEIILENLQYRYCVISGLCENIYRPEIRQIAHYNFFQITINSPLVNAGASPGIIASALYLSPYWLAPMFSALYYFFLSLSIDYGVVKRTSKLSIVGYLIALLLMRIVLLNPADLFIIFTPSFIYLVGFTFVTILAHGENRKKLMMLNQNIS